MVNSTLPRGQSVGTASGGGSPSRGVTSLNGQIGALTSYSAGTLTGVAVATANGFAGSSSGGVIPTITLTTTISGIVSGNGTAFSAASTTGSGNVVLATSPTLTTPVLGTPSSGTLSSCTGFPAGSLSGLGAGVATFLATPSSANLAGAVTGETGSGALVFADTPTLVTPVLGAATATSINGLTITASTGTATIANGKVATINSTLTFSGTDTSSVAFGTGGTVAYLGNSNTFTKTQAGPGASLTSTSNHIAWDGSTVQVARHTATEDTTLDNPSNIVANATYIFIFTQAATPKTLAFGNAYKWPSGTAPTVSTGNGDVDIFTFVANSAGTILYGTYQYDFS